MCPIYTYKCEFCGRTEDLLRSISKMNDKVECEKCSKCIMERQLTAPSSFVFDSGAVGSKNCSNKRG